MSPTEILDARKRGIIDNDRGIPRTACPFHDAEKALAWQRGHDEAEKKKPQPARCR